MFSYLRYFSAISLVFVIVAAYFVGVYFKSLASEDLEDLVSKNNTTLAQGYINSIWKKHNSVIKKLKVVKVSKWVNYQQFHDFKKDTLHYFEEMPVSNMTLYTADGEVIVSTDSMKDQASFIALKERPAFSKSINGEVISSIMEDVTYYLSNGNQARGTIIKTYAPVYSDDYVAVVTDSNVQKVAAVIELHYNITNHWDRLKTFQIISTGGIIGLFVILIAMLIISSRKAESIIARQHEVNLELTAAAASAEAESRDKTQFLANISHELRTPLNAIIGFSEIIRNESLDDLNEVHRGYIKDINNSGVHLLSLINDILDFSKAEAGKLEVSIAEIDVVKLVKNSMRLVIPRAEEAQVTLVEELPPKHFSLQTDAKKLKQILLNLLSNSVKFTPAGGQVSVAVWHNRANDSITIKVADTGIGIEAKDVSKVMTAFGQVDSKLSRKYEGTGLGLPLSKKFVEILGGTLSIDSEVDKGTTIIINFPRTFEHEA